MKASLCITLLVLGTTALAQSELGELPAKETTIQASEDPRVLSTQQIIDALYKDPDCRFMGFSVSNHRMQYPLHVT